MKFFSLLILCLSLATIARAEKLQIKINRSQHQLTIVTQVTKPIVMPINVGSLRHPTPAGCSPVVMMQQNYISRIRGGGKPVERHYSIWYHNNYVIYGVDEVIDGRSDTGGSVQLAMSDAAYLFSLVHTVGKDETVVCVE